MSAEFINSDRVRVSEAEVRPGNHFPPLPPPSPSPPSRWRGGNLRKAVGGVCVARAGGGTHLTGVSGRRTGLLLLVPVEEAISGRERARNLAHRRKLQALVWPWHL